MCAAQGIDLRAPLRPGRLLREAHAAVRACVPRLLEDRVLSPDIKALAAGIGTGAFAPSDMPLEVPS
jgi:histidine ammonia-lyase